MAPGTPVGKVSINTVIVSVIVVLLLSNRTKLLWWLLSSLLVSGYILYLGVSLRPGRQHYNTEIKRFKFLESLQWTREVSHLSIDRAVLEAPAVLESFLISEALDQLFSLIISEFVDSWYSRITSDRLFQNSIHVELKGVISGLKERLASIDLANFLVFKIVPIITDHYTTFMSTANVHDSIYSMESKLSTAQKFDRGRHHEGVSLSLPGTPKKKEKEFLRKKVTAILPYLLSLSEHSNETVLLLLREILACTILANVTEVLCEGDFFNQMIVKLVGANLQHRDQVKRLRAALQEHTAQNSKRAPLPSLFGPLTASKTAAWTNYIDGCESRAELLTLQSALQKKQASIATSSEDFQSEDDQLAVLSDRLSWKLNISKNDNVTLETILSQSDSAAVFREFLRGEKHESDIDLWQAIDRIKAPLETSNTAGQIPLFLEFSNKDDIIQIYSSFFDDPHIPISDEVRKSVSSYVKCSGDDKVKAEYYQQARKSLFLLQDTMVEHMKNHHFRAFQRSNRFGDLELGKKSRRVRREASLAFGGSKIPSELIDIDSGSDGISPGVVKAVETAFEQIMKSSSEHDSTSLFHVPSKSSSDLNISEKPYLFGDSSNLFSDGEKPDDNAKNRMSALFDDDSDTASDSASVNSENLLLSTELGDSKLASLEIILAAPGDLTLAEQIATLNQDIDSLTEQDAILASLLRKAELTNNTAELRVLKKSKVSVEREISSKELQKQQYIVQENENSLYGKSKVQIQSCVYRNDSSTPYVLYIIEVQKFSSDDPHEIVAGWVVARRFRQFYKLNEYLKRRCPEVANIKFPKKSVPVLTFQKKLQVELRKPMLENYLQSLLKIPEVCSDPAFRSFLSSEEFLLGPGDKAPQKNFDAFFNRFYGKLGQRVPVANTEQNRTEDDQEILANIQEMERELKQFDDIERGGAKIPFVKPISDLLMAMFNLRNSQSWLRGRALLVILQQVLGSTVEKTIKQQVDANLRQEEKLLDILSLLQTMLFPNNKFRETPEIRTKSEQSSTRKEANVILRIFMNETCAKVFGFKNTIHASTCLFEMFQNDYLNKQLMFEILDQLLVALFPEAEEN